MTKTKTWQPKVTIIDGRMCVIGRSGQAYPLDDYDTLDEAYQAAHDMPPNWTDDEND